MIVQPAGMLTVARRQVQLDGVVEIAEPTS
jgi:hypothetical protein